MHWWVDRDKIKIKIWICKQCIQFLSSVCVRNKDSQLDFCRKFQKSNLIVFIYKSDRSLQDFEADQFIFFCCHFNICSCWVQIVSLHSRVCIMWKCIFDIDSKVKPTVLESVHVNVINSNCISVTTFEYLKYKHIYRTLCYNDSSKHSATFFLSVLSYFFQSYPILTLEVSIVVDSEYQVDITQPSTIVRHVKRS